jgi:hypothetical protein
MSDLFTIDNLRISLDVKEITEAGNATSSASGNVTISVAKNFAAITAIQITPKLVSAPGTISTARYYTGVVFDESTPNPTSFQVFILDNAGARVAIPFSWMVRGTQGGV